MNYPGLLKYGMRNNESVKYVQNLLQQEGYFFGRPRGNFLEKTREAVFWFQATHVGPDRKFLDADGLVGPNTWWALHNPSGDPQANHIDPVIPSGLDQQRVSSLQLAIEERNKGVREEPDGSNWGPEIAKYGGRPGWAWCALFMNWVYKQSLGYYPGGRKDPSCYRNWKLAEKLGRWEYKESYTPTPGDAFIMQYRNSKGQLTGRGHTGIILRVSSNGELFNAVEGNTKNRIAITLREVSNSTILGYINPYSTTLLNYEKGVMLGNITSYSLRDTR